MHSRWARRDVWSEDVMEQEPDVRDDDVMIIKVTGEFDAYNLPRFCENVASLLEEDVRSWFPIHDIVRGHHLVKKVTQAHCL